MRRTTTDFSLCAGPERLAVFAGQQAQECPAAMDPGDRTGPAVHCPSAASAPDVRSASVGHHDQAPIVDPDRAEHLRVGGGTIALNRAIREDDHLINRVAPTGTRLTDGVELARVRFLSKTADLYVTGIENVPAMGRMGSPAR